MLPPQNGNNSINQQQQNQQIRAQSSSNNAYLNESSTKNSSLTQINSQGAAVATPSNSNNRPESSNNRQQNARLNTTKQLNISSMINNNNNNNNNNLLNSNSAQKTNYTMYSNCTNCTDLEKEVELLRQIIKQCGKCQHSYLSNSSSNSLQIHNADSSDKMQMLDPENNQDCNNHFGGGNSNQAQYMLEKINNLRLTEQVQQLMRQLEQVVIERDSLKSGHFNQSQEILTKIQKYEAQIKQLQTSHLKMESNLGNYAILKTKLQDFINSCLAQQSSNYQPENPTQNNQELIQECLFIKDFISQQQSQINTLNQRSLIIAKPSLQNNSQLYNHNNNNPVSFSQDNNNNNNKSNLGELVNQQLVLEEREQMQNQYQNIPSAIKALEIVHKMRNITSINPFLPNQLQA